MSSQSYNPDDRDRESEESEWNPYEVSRAQSNEDASTENQEQVSPYEVGPYDSEGADQRIPPVESGYWSGIIVMGALIALFLLGITPYFLPVSAIVQALFSLGGLSIWLLPMMLVRLVLHRGSISRAIRSGRYPGGQIGRAHV